MEGITILKRTPKTAFGRDVMELLVEDKSVWCDECCEKCCYRDYAPSSPEFVDCCTIHGCTTNPHSYFMVEQLDVK